MKALILKYLTHTITEEELIRLREWLQKPKNQEKFKTYVRDVYNVNLAYNKVNVEQAYQKVWNTIQKEKKPIYRLYWRYAAAAVVVGMLATAYFYRDNLFSSPQETVPIIVNNQIEVGTDKAILTLESGEEVTLEKGTQFQTQNATSNGEEIIYESGKRNKSEVAYNTLTIPRGGQFYIVLSDGTKVWLNSESQIKYPVAFTEGETRQINLIYGEAYFEVSPSTEHKGSKFKVMHHAQEVEVLGTEFNIKAYKDETNVYTTLVEGKVAVSTTNENQILAPTQQSNLDLVTNSINVTSVDVRVVTSWKDGLFDFEKMPLKEIMKVLSRWYDMEVEFSKENLESVILTGVFKKSQSIEEIMSALQSTNYINSYEIHDKTIILK